MKVRELIEQLRKLDPEAIVFTHDMAYWDGEVESAEPAEWIDLDGAGGGRGMGVKIS